LAYPPWFELTSPLSISGAFITDSSPLRRRWSCFPPFFPSDLLTGNTPRDERFGKGGFNDDLGKQKRACYPLILPGFLPGSSQSVSLFLELSFITQGVVVASPGIQNRAHILLFLGITSLLFLPSLRPPHDADSEQLACAPHNTQLAVSGFFLLPSNGAGFGPACAYQTETAQTPPLRLLESSSCSFTSFSKGRAPSKHRASS